jgi:hypothetical protein
MATRKIQRERVQDLNEADVREGDYVLYWMQSSQRADHNHAVSKRRWVYRTELCRVSGCTYSYLDGVASA